MVEQVKLLSLSSDFVFRALFTRSTNSLIHLVNSALGFEGEKKVKSLELLSPEILKNHLGDKSAILDIKAQSLSGEVYNVEMQAFSQDAYAPRVLYYWAKLYASQLAPGQEYRELKNTYSINFLNFNLIDISSYKSSFLILEKDHPQIQLTEKFQMMFFELPKFEKHLKKVGDNLELWLYVMKNTSSLDEKKMRIIVDKSPSMQETFEELRKISIDPRVLSLEEAKRKAEMDHYSRLGDSFRAGEREGMEEGKKEGKADVAKTMLSKGFSLSDITEATGLPEAELSKLKSELDKERKFALK